ncbi:MAG TPA: SCO family protein [Blastocatellia bacterium]
MSKDRDSKAVYYCPMHPDVRSAVPGKCPKCGMDFKLGIPPTQSPNVAPPGKTGQEVPSIPDTVVYDQNGKSLHFFNDLVKGKTVAIDFIFTTCTTICPPLTATMRKVQQELGDRVGHDIQLISVTVDPATDVPARLKSFADKFSAQPGWTFVTGDKQEMDKLTLALGAYVGNKTDHSPMILIGNEPAGYWTRTYGLAPPSKLTALIQEAAAKGAETGSASAPERPAGETQVPLPRQSDGAAQSAERQITKTDGGGSAIESTSATQPVEEKEPTHIEEAANYFPNVVLITQDGKPVHFFNDLVRGKIVLINFMFTTCTGICPSETANLVKVQQYLGDHVGRDVNMISITVDPKVDTPAALKKYAAQYHVKEPGWYFLTGDKRNVDWVLYKLGSYVQDPGDHNTFVIIGNAETGKWSKMFSMLKAGQIADTVVKMIPPKSAEQEGQ